MISGSGFEFQFEESFVCKFVGSRAGVFTGLDRFRV